MLQKILVAKYASCFLKKCIVLMQLKINPESKSEVGKIF